MATPNRQRARRTQPEVRREQLVRSAVRRFADHGYPDVELRDIASEVGVTPNLIHHYFPGGKAELHLEAVRLACSDLVEVLDVSEDLPLDRKMPSNITAYIDYILEPRPAYLLYARATRSADEDVRRAAIETRHAIAGGVARNHLGTARPPRRVRAALVGFLAFAEATAEQWRELGLRDRGRLERLLADVLVATVASARGA